MIHGSGDKNSSDDGGVQMQSVPKSKVSCLIAKFTENLCLTLCWDLFVTAPI
jgi:hypothetical protein